MPQDSLFSLNIKKTFLSRNSVPSHTPRCPLGRDALCQITPFSAFCLLSLPTLTTKRSCLQYVLR